MQQIWSKQDIIEQLRLMRERIHSSDEPFMDSKHKLLSDVACTQQHYTTNNFFNLHRKQLIKNLSREMINQRSEKFGNTPLLLAVSKGYNHVNTLDGFAMCTIIDELLARPDLEINAQHTDIGLTALEIAIMRRDDINFIEKLIAKGAVLPNNTEIIRLLSYTYDDVQQIITDLTGGDDPKDLHKVREDVFILPNHAATLPLQNKFDDNEKAILAFVAERTVYGTLFGKLQGGKAVNFAQQIKGDQTVNGKKIDIDTKKSSRCSMQ